MLILIFRWFTQNENVCVIMCFEEMVFVALCFDHVSSSYMLLMFVLTLMHCEVSRPVLEASNNVSVL